MRGLLASRPLYREWPPVSWQSLMQISAIMHHVGSACIHNGRMRARRAPYLRVVVLVAVVCAGSTAQPQALEAARGQQSLPRPLCSGVKGHPCSCMQAPRHRLRRQGRAARGGALHDASR
jgi:hypothetical protein